jgi:hypothetical protein
VAVISNVLSGCVGVYADEWLADFTHEWLAEWLVNRSVTF